MPSAIPSVLFLCVHNAGRSQMAAAWFARLAGDRARVSSRGSEPAHELNPVAVEAMREAGIDLTGGSPRRWTEDEIRAVDVVVTMGCGDACPLYPGVRYIDWPVDDPQGQPLSAVRRVRDDIEGRVRALLDDLGVTAVEPADAEPR